MRVSVMIRGVFVASLVAAGLSVGGTAAQADPVCAGASVSSAAGTYGANRCVPYSGPTLCHWDRVSLGTLLSVTVSSCHPW